MATQTTKLQIPITQHMKDLLKTRIHEFGFTSINEAVRVLLKQFSEGHLSMMFFSNYAPMVDEETEKRIGESLAAYERGEYRVIDPSQDKDAIKKALKSML